VYGDVKSIRKKVGGNERKKEKKKEIKKERECNLV